MTRHHVLVAAVKAGVASEGPTAARDLLEEELARCSPDNLVARSWLELNLVMARLRKGSLGRVALSEDEARRIATVFEGAPADLMAADGLSILGARAPFDSELGNRLLDQSRQRAQEIGDSYLALSTWALTSWRLGVQGRPDLASGCLTRAGR